MPRFPSWSYNVETKKITVVMSTNPAIWVPSLNKIVWGSESWWGPITTPEQVREITDSDIESQWYVQALKASIERADAEV
jgi:hypothetical protein